MIYTGVVFESQNQPIASIEVTTRDEFQHVEIKINDVIVIEFPLTLDADINQIVSATRNVVNQTGLVTNPVTVEIAPVE